MTTPGSSRFGNTPGTPGTMPGRPTTGSVSNVGMSRYAGQPPVRSWLSLNYSERQRLYSYGKRSGLSEEQTRAAYETGQPIGTTRYQRGVVRGVSSGRRPIQHRGLFERSPSAQQRYMREAQRHVPGATPEQVDEWIREGSFRPAARSAAGRVPSAVVGRDPQYAAGRTLNDFGSPVNANDSPAIAAMRADAVNEARSFIRAERQAGNVKANEASAVENIQAMTPEQLALYMEQDDSERKMFAMAEGADYGEGQTNLWHYH